jgi:hypothetical protein
MAIPLSEENLGTSARCRTTVYQVHPITFGAQANRCRDPAESGADDNRCTFFHERQPPAL